jgi:hypothetical protein
MTKKDFISIHVAHRNLEVQNVFILALMGGYTKSEFVDAYCDAPHIGRNHRKAKSAKQGMYFADLIEREQGIIWK